MASAQEITSSSNYQPMYPHLYEDVETTPDTAEQLPEASAPLDHSLEKRVGAHIKLESIVCFHCIEELGVGERALVAMSCGHAAHAECVAEQLARNVSSGLFKRDRSGRSFCYACNADSATPNVNTPKRAIVEKTFIDKYNQRAHRDFWSLTSADLESDECHALYGTSLFSMASFTGHEAPHITFESLRARKRTFNDLIQAKGVNLITLYRAGLSLDNLIELGFSPAQHLQPAYHRLVPPWQLSVLYHMSSDDFFQRAKMGTRIIATWRLNAPEMFLFGLTAPLLLRHNIEKATFLAMPPTLEQWTKYLGLEPCHLVELGIRRADLVRNKDIAYYDKFMRSAE